MSSVGQQLFRWSFLQAAMDRFTSPELLNFVRCMKIDLVQVESLKRTSAKIQALYDEAESKQFSSDAVKLWLYHVKQLLYDAEDILDEFATELLRLKLESCKCQTLLHQTQQSGRESEGIHKTIKAYGSKVRDMNERLQSEAQEGVALGLNFGMLGSGSSRTKVFSQQRPQTSSLVKRSEVFGREDEKWEIIKWLLSENKTASSSRNDNNFSVQPIVGMGGAGKTTLAQLVYNDEIVERHFQLKAWVCVSEDFDELRITKEILESATGSSPSSNSLDTLQKKLKETLCRKRFLLVLDDMWNQDYDRWCALRTPFAFGKAGSKILVTTRNKGVASIVRTVSIHYLKTLSKNHCSAMFRKHAFIDENSSDASQKWKLFGQIIVEKCNGSPLAVKTLAGLLRDKSENYEWNEILENELWYSNETSGILPSLMLSYNHLPPPLKRCFQYCALFPKDYVFNKIELVVLWIAEDIVQVQPRTKRKKRVEDIGAAYFDELFMRSFFELSKHRTYSPFHFDDSMISYKCQSTLPNEVMMTSFFESSSGNIASGYVMHDLIHDLAQLVSNGVFCRRGEHDNKSSEVHTSTRHLSSLMKNFDVEAIESEAMERLRTIIDLNWYGRTTTFQFQFQFQFLRVLSVRNCPNREFPDSIGKLKQLRLFDISFSKRLVRLPDSVTTLYNLQTLLLTGCVSLNELPEDIGNLVNLRHLSLPEQMPQRDYLLPLGVGNLSHLQRLRPLTVGSKNSRVLKDLSQLHGILEITNLENLGNINGIEPVLANLKNKPHIVGLCLHWSAYERGADSFPDMGRDEKVEEDVLDQLQPHTNLQVLWVANYGGTRFPSWMEYPSCFSNLETVELIGCYNCKFLPHLQQLPLLKHLKIDGCRAKNMVGGELCGDGSSSLSSAHKQFRSLEKLTIRYMEEWEEWSEVVEGSEEGGGQFPCLRQLIIEHCPKLRELPRLLPSLRHLSITGSPKLMVLPRLPFIEKLRLGGCERITTLLGSYYPSSFSSTAATTVAPPPAPAPAPAPGIDDSFRCLCELEISECPNLSFPPLLPFIKVLKLVKCKGMAVLNNKMVPRLSSLLSLTIEDVSDLKSLSNGFLQHLTTLQVLNIHNCGDLTVLLQNEIGFDLLPSRLQRLCISQCNNAGKLPQSMYNLRCLQELIIKRAKGLVSLSEELHNLRSLRVLRISFCENLESLPKELHCLTSLQEILIEGCPALLSFPETGLPNAVQKLEIRYCENLRALPKELHTVTSLRQILIKRCHALMSLHKTKLPATLLKLEIIDCESLRSLPEELHIVTSLREILIEKCLALVSLHETKLPASLLRLEIRDCENLRSLPEELHTVTSLLEISIERCPALVSFHETKLPAALLELEIGDCINLESVPIGLDHSLTSLQSLRLSGCPKLKSLPEGLHKLMSLKWLVLNECPGLESFPEMGLPTALQGLTIQNCGKLNLQKPEIAGCSSLIMEGKNQEPQLYKGIRNLTNLQDLTIVGCPALVSIPKGMLPTNLQFFSIYNCPNLESLYALSDISSLKELSIHKCPLLTQRYQMKEGEEWSKISQVPYAIIDGKTPNQFN